jgi:hypothetical protein
MPARPKYPIARALWVLPLLLFVIAAALLRAGLEQREVATSGATVEAEVLEVYTRERSEITRGHARFRYTPPGATAPVERTVEMPLTFLKALEARGEGAVVPLRVLDDRDQVVLADHVRGQWILTLSTAAMALVGALGLVWMVGGWNRYLDRHGDPAVIPGL